MVFLIVALALIISPNYLPALIKSDLTENLNLKSGEKVQGKIRLNNEAAHPIKVTVTKSDYQYNCEGKNFFLDPGALPRSNSSWIELQSDRITIPANGEFDLFYTVQAPDNPALKGSYWSLLLIEPSGPSPDKENKLGIQVKVRYAYQIITTFGGGEAALKILSHSMAAGKEGRKLYKVDVANPGEIYLHPALQLKVFNQNGVLVGDFTHKEQKIVPGSSVRFYLDISDLNEERYPALLLLDNGDDNLFGQDLELHVN